jgi:RHS repeat-associated protein
VSGGSAGSVISYTYDALYRLTRVDYDDGRYFAYAYDEVGNRLSEVACAGSAPCAPITTTYSYDDANRLTAVDAQSYTWDANGNLLADGVLTYTYDAANRLITITQGLTLTTGFLYNGLSDRVSQVVNGVVTTYTLDLAGGLTQVLADGTFIYLYGNGRIAQDDGAEFEYFLGDALGSVRQLVRSAGQVMLARSYEPYGDVLTSLGSGATSYDFTGEWRDGSGLIYLRARWLDSATGTFLSKDTWRDNSRPLSLNGWSFVEGDPVNRIDPSGRSWHKPTLLEGTLIHGMIGVDFLAWGVSNGRSVRVSVRIQGASKARTGNAGYADLVDLSGPLGGEVYEVKHRPSWRLAVSQATWYQQHLNLDPRWSQYAPWRLGNLYLAQYATGGKLIGTWPGDPNHVVRAQLYANGAVVYWGEPRPGQQQPQWQPSPDYIRYLAFLASLGLLGASAGKLRGRGGEGQPGFVNAAVPAFGALGYFCPDWVLPYRSGNPFYDPSASFDFGGLPLEWSNWPVPATPAIEPIESAGPWS